MSITLNGTSGITTDDVTTDTLTSNGIDDNATSTAITIDASENVGIGTASPIQKLQVHTASGPSYISMTNGTTGSTATDGVIIGSASTDGTGYFWNYENAGLGFGTNATERMRIDSSGNLLVGKTVADNSTAGITFFSGGIGSFVADGSRSGTFVRKSSNGAVVEFRRDASTVGSISVTTSATAYNTSSDYRLKENVVSLTGASDRLNQIPVHRFNFIADPDTTVDGFLAHEVFDVVPEAISGAKDEVDNEGNPVYQGIDQSKLVPLLTAALQEALTKIEALETRLSALETN
jgi:hypothetical protein